MCVKPSGHLAAFVSVLIFGPWSGISQTPESAVIILDIHMFLFLTSKEVLAHIAPAGDVFDGGHQTAAGPPPIPLDVG